ncbi:MAG: YggT family protein [Chlamydiota bacterium]
MLIQIIKIVFTIYTLMLIGRILGSWVPQLGNHPIMRFIAYYTDPYLNLFKKIIPPIGGVLDISPLLAFFALQILETILLKLL